MIHRRLGGRIDIERRARDASVGAPDGR